jgi:hypothetical protein
MRRVASVASILLFPSPLGQPEKTGKYVKLLAIMED